MFRAPIVLFCLAALSVSAGDEVAIAFETDARFGSILVPITVNGKPATLLLDTGAASTFVSAELAGVDASQVKRSRFRADGGMEVSGVWESARLELGGRKMTLDVKAVDFAAASERYGRRIDGLLGQDVLRKFARVTIDFRAKRLLLSNEEN